MRNRRLAAVVRAVRRRYPGVRVLVEPFRCPDADPEMRWWLSILNVPLRSLSDVHQYAIRKGFEVYGSPDIPFGTSVNSPRYSKPILEGWRRKMRESRRARGSNKGRRTRRMPTTRSSARRLPDTSGRSPRARRRA